MSTNKASVFLQEPTITITNNDDNKSILTTVLTYSLIVVVVIVSINWLCPIQSTPESLNNTELFNPDNIASRDSFPAHIDSTRSMVCDSDRCHKSILKNRGYVRPYNQNGYNQSLKEKKLDIKKKNVRWSDTLVMYANE